MSALSWDDIFRLMTNGIVSDVVAFLVDDAVNPQPDMDMLVEFAVSSHPLFIIPYRRPWILTFNRRTLLEALT